MNKGSVKIKVEPLILKFGRYCSGYNIAEAAMKIKIAEDKLLAFETKECEISLSRLEKLAAVYKIPLAFFLLKEVPKDVVLPKDFRIVYATRDIGFSPSVMLAIRRARYVQSIIQELDKGRPEYKFRKVTITSNVESIATYFRSVIGISVGDQSKWPNPSSALKNWKVGIEKLGIFIMQQSLKEEDVSAFCLADQSPYILVLNSGEHENRRMFSLFHEIGHILLRHSGVCTPDNLSRNSKEYAHIEKFCNQFAASLLVPHDEFLTNSIVIKLNNTPFEQWDPKDIKELSSRFRVSQEVIYRRLVTIGILDEGKYQRKRKELIESFEEYKKKSKDKKVIIPQYKKVISKNGHAYSSFILDNLHSNRITLTEAANYLDTNSRHITSVESHL